MKTNFLAILLFITCLFVAFAARTQYYKCELLEEKNNFYKLSLEKCERFNDSMNIVWNNHIENTCIQLNKHTK